MGSGFACCCAAGGGDHRVTGGESCAESSTDINDLRMSSPGLFKKAQESYEPESAACYEPAEVRPDEPAEVRPEATAGCSDRGSQRASLFLVGRASEHLTGSIRPVTDASVDDMEDQFRPQVSFKPQAEEGGQYASSGSACAKTSMISVDLKPNRNMSTMAAGHADSVFKDWKEMDDVTTGIPEYVMKALEEGELNAYRNMKASEDILQRCTPGFYGEVSPTEMDFDPTEDMRDKRFIRLTNLLKGFVRGPHVMDCKLGARSFQEDEVHKSKPRADLYQRMLALDSSEPTVEEHEQKGCTKYRWMSFNDKLTHLSSNYFRIDGITTSRASSAGSGPGSGATPKGELKKLRTLSDMAGCIIKNFLPSLPDDRTGLPTLEMQCTVADSIIRRLQEIRRLFASSPFARRHSFVGSSALFIVDAKGPKADVFLIDFAKTEPVPDDVTIDHTSAWKLGNHEDCLLLGFDNMIKTWEIVLATLSAQM